MWAPAPAVAVLRRRVRVHGGYGVDLAAYLDTSAHEEGRAGGALHRRAVLADGWEDVHVLVHPQHVHVPSHGPRATGHGCVKGATGAGKVGVGVGVGVGVKGFITVS